MKRTVGWLILFFLACAGPRGFCDSAPVVPTQSGTVKPVESKGVVLDSEVVHVYLGKKQYNVEVDYWFRNMGPAQTVTMGFPNEEGMYSSAIKDFAAFVGPEMLAVRRKEAPPPEKDAPVRLWYECFDVPFRTGEIVHVRNTYVQQYMSNDTSKKMRYVLKTGRFWKGPIHRIQVYLHFPASPLRYNERRLAYGIAGKTDVYHSAFADATLRIEPESYTLHGDTAEMLFEDVEPDFDIRLTLPPWLSETVSASSTLEDESGRYSYEPQNVLDGDHSTSWVEGAAGPGIGERLRFSIAPSMAKGKATGFYLIDRIGIINGYAASQELYRANNRVKRIGVSYNYDTDYGSFPGPEMLEFVLKETTEMQYIELPKPLPVSSLELTILDVYSGRRYDDTCIAEVHLHAVAEPIADVLSLLPILLPIRK